MLERLGAAGRLAEDDRRRQLAEAFCGFFTDQHAFWLGKLLARVDGLDGDLAELDASSRS